MCSTLLINCLDAEYKTLANDIAEATWLQSLPKELRIPQQQAAVREKVALGAHGV